MRDQKQEVKRMIKEKRSLGDMLNDKQKEIIEAITKDLASKQDKNGLEETKEMNDGSKAQEKTKSPSKQQKGASEALKIAESLLESVQAPHKPQKNKKDKASNVTVKTSESKE